MASNVLGLDFARLQYPVHAVQDQLAIVAEIDVVQHVSERHQHGRGVGYALASCLRVHVTTSWLEAGNVFGVALATGDTGSANQSRC